MPDPSDVYTWRDFLIDLQRHGCEFGVRPLKNGLKLPIVSRRLPDGTTRTSPFTPRRLEGAVHREKAEDVLRRLAIDVADFFD